MNRLYLSIINFCLISLFIVQPTTAQNLSKVYNTGPKGKRINIVFLSEGYQENELNIFQNDVSELMQDVLETTPYSNYKEYFNAYAISIASNESGSTHPSEGIYRDTYFESTYDTNNISRLLTLSSTGIQRAQDLLIELFPEYDIPIVIVNDDKYGGSGGWLAVTSVNPSASEILIHELGHSFANLADEYETPYPGWVPMEFPNVTAQTSFENIRWNIWIDESTTPIPTPEINEYKNHIGLFEGAQYQSSGWYRPKQFCKMRSLGIEFCEVCNEQHVFSIYQLLSPVEGVMPNTQELIATLGEVIVFQLTTKEPIIPLDIDWFVNDEKVDEISNIEFIFESNNFGTGTYEITAKVTDNSDFVQNTNLRELLSKTVSWTVEVTQNTDPDLTVSYSEGWNLVGIPIQTEGLNYQTHFETITQEPYQFSSGYQFVSELAPETGFWVHLEEQEVKGYSEPLLESSTIDLDADWNLISGLGYPISIADISDPQSIINSDWFGFDGAYSSTETIEPGKGYWVRTSEAGSISLDSQTGKLLADSKDQFIIGEQHFNTLVFTSGRDTLQTLYFGEPVPKTVKQEWFSMPPLPPAEAFDARFAREKSWLSESLNPRVNIQSGNKEIGVHLQVAGNRSTERWQLVQFVDNEVIKRSTVQDEDQIMLFSAEVNRLELVPVTQQMADQPELPGNFELEQNFPNPFNPTTTIRISLPRQSRVEIVVYNIVGRQVGTIVNRVMEAGNHTVPFEASSLTSGVYFYEMRAGSFRQIKKLTVIK